MMERIDSCASTLSDINLPLVFSVGDRVRRIGSGTAGTVRYVGPLLTPAAVAQTTASSPSEQSTSTSNSSAQQQMMMISSSGGGSENSASTALPPVDSLQEINTSPVNNLGDSTSFPSPASAAAASLLLAQSDPSSQPTYVGVEWDRPEGKNNGTVQGVKYFECEQCHGSLLPAKNLSKGLTLVRALESRYGSSTVRQEAGVTPESVANRTASKPMQLGPAIGFRDKESGAFTRVVSSDCTANDTLRLVCAAGDNLGQLFPNLQDLSLAGTLFASWEDVALIGAELPCLRTLDVGRNLPLGCPSRSPLAQRPGPPVVISATVKELRMSDIGSMTPACMECILSQWFPALESLFAARNNLTLEGSALLKAPVPRVVASHSRMDSSSVNTNDDDSWQQQRNSSSSPPAPATLTYLNVEGNPLETLDDVARLLGLERCKSLLSLNVSGTLISDSEQLPDVHPASVYQYIQQQKSSNTSSSNNNNTNSESPTAASSSMEGSPAAKSPQKSPGGTTTSIMSASTSSSSNNNNSNRPRAQLDEPPLFPNLVSLYMNKVPVVSWASLSRLLHRAAYCDTLQDVHFSTCAQHQKETGEGEDEDDDDDTDSVSSSMASSHIDNQRCFLPEDFRDRRRMSVAFMPPTVKKLNRSEITSVERATALQRSVDTFSRLVHKSEREVEREMEEKQALQEEEEEAEKGQQQEQQKSTNKKKKKEEEDEKDDEKTDPFDDFCPRRFGQLPFHLQKAICIEQVKQKPATGGTAGGPGFIYRPPAPGPRRMLNEFDIHMRTVFLTSKQHQELLEKTGFMTILHPEESGGATERAATLKASGAAAAGKSGVSSRVNADIVPLQIDVRWETQNLEEAVRAKLGLVDGRAKVQMIHVDRELMDNPGAVAQRLHLKPLRRPWEKLHTSRFSAGDDLLVLVGP